MEKKIKLHAVYFHRTVCINQSISRFPKYNRICVKCPSVLMLLRVHDLSIQTGLPPFGCTVAIARYVVYRSSYRDSSDKESTACFVSQGT